jgi:hypothetical protein
MTDTVLYIRTYVHFRAHLERNWINMCLSQGNKFRDKVV